ncbi:DRC11 protein, partial [Grantiella picta]|nr:DRC11 protein [Grantiella picta]
FPSSTYIKIWADTQKDLDIMLEREREEFSQPEEDREKVMTMLTTCYIKYLDIIRNFKAVHDNLIHQQKREAVRQVLDGVMGRLLEIKKEMVSLDKTECHYMDDILVDLKRVPEAIEIPIPEYFIKENQKNLQERAKYLDEILLNADLLEQEPVTALTLEEGIKVIQVAERARQGRARAAFMKKIYLEEKRQAKQEDKTGKDPDAAATCIQRVWRGYSQRMKTEKLREEEMIFLGMVSGASLPPHLEVMSSLQIGARKADVLQGEVQEKENLSFFQELRKTEGPHIKETLQDQLTQCFIECRHITGRFPDYPPEMTGGSKAIFIEKHPQEVLDEMEAKREVERQKAEEGKFKKIVKKEEEEPKKGGKQIVDTSWKMGPSNFLSILEEGSSQYKVFWENRDNKSDFLQDHDPELIKEGEREGVEEEIRVQVDEVMQDKLLKIKQAVDGETGLGKHGKAGKAEEGKKKKKKRCRKPRKRGQENLMMSLACRTIESLYQELAEEGLLIKVKKVNLSDYIGYYNCLRNILRDKGVHPMPSIPEVRQLVSLYGILPLGSQTVHENAPLVKSLLLAGPSGVGKKMLVHAICTETGANLFHLTPSNIAGKYPGRKGMVMMFHMILKVGKSLQPSVLWVGNVEKVFAKGGGKGEEEMNAKRLAKFLPPFLRAVRATDRVLLVGTTRRPFDANPGPFCKVFQKIVLLSKPDYLTRYGKYFKLSSWLLLLGGVLSRLVNLNSLAQVSDGFTQGHIVDAVQTVLTERRVLQIPRKPLRSAEFLTCLARHDPVYAEEEETFQ